MDDTAAVSTAVGQDLYARDIKKKVALTCVGVILLLVLFVIDLGTGSSHLKLFETLQVLIHPSEASKAAQVIVFVYRVPMSVMAVAVGIALGLAGALMQTLLNNYLASPYTLGISSGAGFGAALAIVVGARAYSFLGQGMVPVLAFAGACISSVVIFMFTRDKMTAQTMVLAGIGLSFMFSALQALVQYLATPDQNQNIVFWIFGSLSRATLPQGIAVLAVCAVALPYSLSKSWKLMVMSMGDERADAMGVNVRSLRAQFFGIVTILTALCVSFVGTIGFIGLAAPHMARMLVGEDQRWYLLASPLMGGCMLCGASIISKLLVPGYVFPIGIITSLIGVPIFFWLVMRQRKKAANV